MAEAATDPRRDAVEIQRDALEIAALRGGGLSPRVVGSGCLVKRSALVN